MTNKLIILLISSISLLISTSVLAELPKWQHYLLPIKSELRGSGATNKTLWVVGDKNAVFISKDNGTSWRDISPTMKITASDDKTLEYNFRDIEVFNDTTAIVMSVGSGAESTLQITRNQGKTWQILRTNKEAKGFYDSIGFWDEQNGVMVGDPINGHFVIELTKDQGKTWSRIPIDKLPTITEKEAAFAASGNTLIVGKMGEIWLATGGLSASVYHSTDFGQTWTKSSVALENTTETSGGYALGLNSQQEVFVLGGNYLKRDGHYNNMATLINNEWQVVESGGNGLRTAMSCVHNICISTGKRSSDISLDNGKSWQVFSNQGFYTLTSNDKNVLAAGSAGKVAVLVVKD